MTIRRKIIGTSLASALLVTLVGLVGAINLVRSGNVFSNMGRVELREVDDTGQIARTAARLHAAIDAYIASTLRGETNQRQAYTTPIETHFDEINTSIAQMEDRLRHETGKEAGAIGADGPPANQLRVDLIKSGVSSSRRIWIELSTSLDSSPITPSSSRLVEHMGEAIQSLTDATMDFQRTVTVDMMGVVEKENKRAAIAVKILEAVALVAISSALLLGWTVARPMALRLSRLKEATARVGAGDLETHIDLESEDEIGQLAKAFNEMAVGLCRSRDEGRASDSRFRELAEVIREVFWMSDPSCSKITYVSPAYEEVWGLSRESLYKDARSFVQAIVPEDRPRVMSGLNDIGTLNEEYRIRRPNGDLRWVHARGFGVLNDKGEIERVVGIAADVTARRIAEEAVRSGRAELEHRVVARTAELQLANDALRRNEVDLEHTRDVAEAANKAKSEFLARMSHEIRTPLNGVVGMADLLLGSGLTLEQTSYAELTKSSADTLLRLVNDVLDFSKIEAGKLELERISFEIHSIVESTVAMLASKAAGKGLELASFVDLDVPTQLIGDPDRLRQVLINLTNNALKFTSTGEVTVRVKVTKKVDVAQSSEIWLRFDVQDTGIGIPPERLDRLFRPFSQVDSSTTRQYGGTGLGLVICRELTELMKGSMGVESVFGKGSTFWFTVPFTVAEVPTSESERTVVAAVGLPVLVVSGQEVQREILCDQLTSMSMNPVAAASVNQAMESLHDSATSGKPIPVVLVDSSLPDANETIARRIECDDAIGDTTLLLLTPVTAPLKADVLEAAGFVAQVSKPVRQSGLSEHITDAMALDHTSSAPQADQIAPIGEVSHRQTRVLLVEDNVVNQKVALMYLERAGYLCDLVCNGQQAIDALNSRHTYDLVLMDCQMPVIDGFDATRTIRGNEAKHRDANGAARHVPIIALTASAIKGDREACLDAGMDDYLAKPLNARVLIKTVEQLLLKLTEAGQQGPTGARLSDRPDHPTQTDEVSSTGEEMPHRVPPADYDAALENCGGNLAFLSEIVRDFQTQAADNLSQLSLAVKRNDAPDVQRAAHSLSGTASCVSAGFLQNYAATLEEAARNNSLEAASSLIDAMAVEVANCVRYLNSTLRKVETEQDSRK